MRAKLAAYEKAHAESGKPEPVVAAKSADEARAEEVRKALEAERAEEDALRAKHAKAQAEAAARVEAAKKAEESKAEAVTVRTVYATRCCRKCLCLDDDGWDHDVLKVRRRLRR